MRNSEAVEPDVGRYIRSPAIGLNRIEAYDGQTFLFKDMSKTDGVEKMEVVSVEEFIARLILHIPDKQFKNNSSLWHVARRIKNLCKKVLSEWKKQVQRWIVQVNKSLELTSSDVESKTCG